MECPHKQEVFQSGLSSASYDSVQNRVTRTPSSSPAVKLHTTHTTAVITTASALLSEFLFLSEGAVLGGDVAKLGVGTTVCVSVIKV